MSNRINIKLIAKLNKMAILLIDCRIIDFNNILIPYYGMVFPLGYCHCPAQLAVFRCHVNWYVDLR